MKHITSTESFVLASLITSYPGQEFSSHLATLLNDERIDLSPELRHRLEPLTGSNVDLDELRSTYIAIFDHSKALNPLYETEYGRERAMFKANELSDIAAFYRAFGFELDEAGQKEMLDHISVELEFYSLLKMKLAYLNECDDQAGIEIVSDGMKKFLRDHLGRFSKAILHRPGVQQSEFYSLVFEWVDLMIEEECKRLEVKPEVTSWLSSDLTEDSVSCGGTVSFNK